MDIRTNWIVKVNKKKYSANKIEERYRKNKHRKLFYWKKRNEQQQQQKKRTFFFLFIWMYIDVEMAIAMELQN